MDCKEVQYCDGAGLAMLADLLMESKRHDHLEVEIVHLEDSFQNALDQFDLEQLAEQTQSLQVKKCTPIAEEVGKVTYFIWKDWQLLIQFIGEASHGLWKSILRPDKIRWKEVLQVIENAGVNATPIVCMVCFLIGLIMAFQAAIPLRQFAAELFVANLVGVAMLRELGPLMTAIILAGRSGSAFAAEIGTMKVNEEINALKTMGLNPIPFLVIPRILGAVVITPILTLIANFMGLVGGWCVYYSLGFTLPVYITQLSGSINLTDLMGGLFKAAVFGLLVAGIGCMRGLQTKMGASAVGESTTRAVVSGIILIILADGFFSVLYYYLGI